MNAVRSTHVVTAHARWLAMSCEVTALDLRASHRRPPNTALAFTASHFRFERSMSSCFAL